MCTLIALHRQVPGVPLVVAANRDEFYDRGAEGLALRHTSHGPIVTPRDLRAGGTWLGINRAGVFCAVTNRRGDEPDPERRSRGHLVTDALESGSAAEAVERIETGALRRATYNAFNLLVADAEGAYAITYDRVARRVELGPGVHVVGNLEVGEQSAKTRRLAERAERVAEAPPAGLLDALAELCRSHDDGDPLAGACVHTAGFGTRSSTLLQLSARGDADALRHAEGPPCRAPYQEFTPLLRQLGHGAAAGGESQTRSLR